MYLFLVLEGFFGYLDITYAEALDMVKQSLLFKSCRRNTILSYLLLLLEIFSFSNIVTILYVTSIKIMSLPTMFNAVSIFIVIYFFLSLVIYTYFDEQDYRNRTGTELLDVETVERLENMITGEKVEISQQIAVPTDFLTRNSSN